MHEERHDLVEGLPLQANRPPKVCAGTKAPRSLLVLGNRHYLRLVWRLHAPNRRSSLTSGFGTCESDKRPVVSVRRRVLSSPFLLGEQSKQ